MAWSLTPARRNTPELMDAPGLPEAEVMDAYRVLGRVNLQLGNLRTMRRQLRTFLREQEANPAGPSLLDVGSGSGDIAEALHAQLVEAGRQPVAVVLDRDPVAAGLARQRGLRTVRGDALRLPFSDASIDLTMAIKFAHHFEGRPLARLVAELARVARRQVVILDIRRSWLAYWGFVAWSRVFTRNRLVRADGPLSVLRGFTPEELATLSSQLADFSWTVQRDFGFQVALIGRRIKR